MKYCFYILILIIIINACENKKDTDCQTYYQVTDISKNNGNVISVRLTLDSLLLDSTIESSFMGIFWIANDTLLFSDIFYNYIYRFDKKGSVIDRYLGKGKGPNEVLDFMYSFPLQDGYCFVSASNHFVYLFDKSWKNSRKFRIDWDVKTRFKEILNHPNPQEIEPYELDFGIPDKVKQWDHNHLAVALCASHPKFNGYFNSSLFYNQSRILALVNIETGKIDELVGRRSPFYLYHRNIPNFNHFSFEITGKELLVSFWPDSSIYIIDKSSKAATKKFGKPGRDMRTNYTLTNTFEDAELNLRKDWYEFGYYSYLVYEPKSKFLFRGYTKGKGAKSDGLQVYSDYQLVGDLNVPLGFKIIGSVGDEILASCDIDGNASSFYIYKLHFEYEK